ncbi:GNAT family N-acetyltransferase [Streptomyces sp. NPDC057445]|uniref:GNAT family N-acetyltransferase n=1 Tax=Streptomyces sp. NPDC057445 TaxID=3346136 RepID=UPI00367F39B0
MSATDAPATDDSATDDPATAVSTAAGSATTTSAGATTTGAAVDEWQDPAEAEQAGWARLAGDEDFFLTPEWMRVLHDTAGAPMRYLTASRPGSGHGPVAGLPLVFADRTAPWSLGRTDLLMRHCAAENMDGAAALLAAFEGADRLMPSLMAGGRHLGRTRLLLAARATAEDADRVVARAERIAADMGAASVCFPYLDAADERVARVLGARGYLSHTSGEFASLDVPAGGFPEYALGLPSRRSRRVRAERRRIEASGVRITLEPLVADEIPRLAELETELFAKYGMTGWDPARSAAVFAAAQRTLGPRALVSKAVSDGEIVGFGLILHHGSHWFAHRAGFDYERQGELGLPLYYELLYYTPADHAPSRRVTRIHYGIGSTAAKVSRGCVLSTQYLYVKELGR